LTKTITGNWVLPNGSPVANGTLYLQLNQPAIATATPAQVAPRINAIGLDSNGSIPSNTVLLANDEMNPSGTFYRASVEQAGGGTIYGPENFTITGSSPINLNLIVPT
jgi:hypothetical protein